MVKCCCDDSVTKNIPKLVFMLPFIVYFNVVLVGQVQKSDWINSDCDLNKNSFYSRTWHTTIGAILVKIVYFISFSSRFLFTFFLSQCSLRLIVLRNLGHAVLAKVQSASCVE